MSQGTRRLAAIMFTDMVGYTALGQRDESLSLALVEEQRKVIRPIIGRHNGREVKTIGDAFLVEFRSALDAVRCAYDIQRAIKEFNFSLATDKRIHLRIGLHLGEVVESQGDISGDAVNVASRIEPLAEDGGVCLSRQVYDHVHDNKLDLPLASLGHKSLKNVSEPIEVYKLLMPWEKEGARDSIQPDTKRIAVLPFANMSPDPVDEYFADGMTEELISTISKIEQVEVISRTSVMQFKRNPKPIKEVSRELEAGTVLEGSIRKAGEKLRVSVQIIDAAKDRHLWAESYDRELRDVFSIQTDIAKQVADALKIRILPGEKAKLERTPTSNMEAYTLYLKGRFYWNERSREGVQKAIQYFTEATKKDPKYARAYVGLADCYGILENWGYLPPAETSQSQREYATKALELDNSLSEVHVTLAEISLCREWDPEGAEKEYKRAIELNPNYATAHAWYANHLLGPSGRYGEAISELREAKRLDPLSAIITSNLGDQLANAGRYQEAEEQYRNVIEGHPDFGYAHSRLGTVLLKESRNEEGIAEIQRAVTLFGSDETGAATADLIYAYSVTGRHEEAKRLLEELELRSQRKYVANVWLALANAAAGSKERAIGYLQKAASERSNQLGMNLGEPNFDQMRSDQAFQSILRAVGIKKDR